MPSEACSRLKEEKKRSPNVQTVKLEGWTSRHYGKFCVEGSLLVHAALVIMHCDWQLTGHDQLAVENNGHCSRAYTDASLL